VIVGVDIGGTFTDFVVVDPEGGGHVYHKVRSTPADPSRAVLDGLAELGVPLARVERLIHGTTVATNTIIQRSGAVTGLVTTEGHRDVLAIRRGNKPESDVFNLLWLEPEPLVPRYLRTDVGGRLDYRGREVRPLAIDEVDAAAEHLVHHGVEAVAICFLFSYLNAEHERAAATRIRERHPGLELSLSSEILPQWREYERTSTTCADAYVKPVLSRYLDLLASALASGGCEREPLIMKSNGGVMTARKARERPVETFLSGPAGGVVAGREHGRLLGRADLITTDMGGTSFDVSLVSAGELSATTQGWVDPSTPVSVAMLDIRTIGAGGGSIAWIDPGGALKVGPRSAGADPGPACYGLGGTDATVTDANLVLGRLGARTLLGGRLELDPDLARAAIERVGAPLGLDPVRAAAGVIRICVSNMAAEIRAITAERGVDPRGYAILAGGGGGPLHAALIAREFGIRDVVVPPHPGLLSAGGLVLSDLRVDRLRSFPIRIERDGVEALGVAARELVDTVVSELLGEGYEGTPATAVALDMKYTGQNWDITVPTTLDALTAEAVAVGFDHRHEELYGFALPGHTHEVLAIRASAVGPVPDADRLVPRRDFGAGSPDDAPRPAESRPVWDDAAETFVDGRIHRWDELRPGQTVGGPAVVEGMDSTAWIPTGASATVDATGGLLVELPD
jgi:N-methylhydantoinase A